LASNFYVSPEDDYHVHIGSKEYFEILFDDNHFKELDEKLRSKDFLSFQDSKKYADRLKEAHKKSGLNDAIRTAVGKSKGKELVVACMDFAFIGGSMGSVVGEKIARAGDYAIKNHLPLVIISKSGGARMMESANSLMQMAKTSAKLSELAEAKLPFISFVLIPPPVEQRPPLQCLETSILVSQEP
jgi:acetyl-CoA carboxylase carboxyl transferase subunit beta